MKLPKLGVDNKNNFDIIFLFYNPPHIYTIRVIKFSNDLFWIEAFISKSPRSWAAFLFSPAWKAKHWFGELFCIWMWGSRVLGSIVGESSRPAAKPGKISQIRAWKPLLNQRLWSDLTRTKMVPYGRQRPLASHSDSTVRGKWLESVLFLVNYSFLITDVWCLCRSGLRVYDHRYRHRKRGPSSSVLPPTPNIDWFSVAPPSGWRCQLDKEKTLRR